MTSKEAVNLFKQYRWSIPNSFKDKNKALEILEELAERDTPIQIFDMGVDNLGIIRTFICPVCHQWLTFTEKENFCPKCGQRLDWSY